MPRNPSRIAPGDSVDVRQVDTVSAGPVTVPDPERLTHLQFRRYAGCPICNLHLRSFGQRHGTRHRLIGIVVAVALSIRFSRVAAVRRPDRSGRG